MLNHSELEQVVHLGASFRDLLNGEGPAVDAVSLPPKDVRIMLEL